MFYKIKKIKNADLLKKLSAAFITFLFIALSSMMVIAIVSTDDTEPSVAEESIQVTTYQEIATQVEPSEEPEKPLIDIPILYSDVGYSIYYDIDSSNEFLDKVQSAINELEFSISTEEYTLEAIEVMTIELARLQTVADRVESDIAHYITRENEYYHATKVWEYFMQRGYGEVVTSAILGNMMIETSGGTLNINPNIYSPGGSYYGLCQWSVYYYPGVAGLPFEHQLDYLIGDMPYQFNTFGGCYKYGFDYEDFLAMTDPAEAAYAFAKVYERCAAWSCDLRRSPAVLAYNYFKLDN
jgi:hypothetical protein